MLCQLSTSLSGQADLTRKRAEFNIEAGIEDIYARVEQAQDQYGRSHVLSKVERTRAEEICSLSIAGAECDGTRRERLRIGPQQKVDSSAMLQYIDKEGRNRTAGCRLRSSCNTIVSYPDHQSVNGARCSNLHAYLMYSNVTNAVRWEVRADGLS